MENSTINSKISPIEFGNHFSLSVAKSLMVRDSPLSIIKVREGLNIDRIQAFLDKMFALEITEKDTFGFSLNTYKKLRPVDFKMAYLEKYANKTPTKLPLNINKRLAQFDRVPEPGEPYLSLRRKANLTGLNAIFLDIDNDEAPYLTPEYVCSIMDKLGYKYWAYSSYRHSPERPKFRILVPFATTFDVFAYNAAAELLLYIFANNDYAHIIRGRIDFTCIQPHRFFYVPSRSTLAGLPVSEDQLPSQEHSFLYTNDTERLLNEKFVLLNRKKLQNLEKNPLRSLGYIKKCISQYNGKKKLIEQRHALKTSND